MAEDQVHFKDLVNQATDEMLKNPDWSANINIVDRLSRNPAKGARVAELLRARLKHKSLVVQNLAATLLDGLIKNCSAFHRYCATENFMKAVLKIVKEKKKGIFHRRLDNEQQRLQLELREKVLVMIETWAKSFRNSRSFPIFFQQYQQLKEEGVIFPQPLADETAPVFTPPPKKKAPPEMKQESHVKITNRECLAALANAQVFTDMLTASSPHEDLNRHDLIPVLANNIRAAQASCMAKINQGPSENLFGQLLHTNDVLIDALKYFDGLRTGTMERRKPEPKPKAEEKKDEEPAPKEASASPVPKLRPPPKQASNPDLLVLDAPATNGKKKRPKRQASNVAEDDLLGLGIDGPPEPAPAQAGESSSDDAEDVKESPKREEPKPKPKKVKVPTLIAPPGGAPSASPEKKKKKKNKEKKRKKEKKKKKRKSRAEEGEKGEEGEIGMDLPDLDIGEDDGKDVAVKRQWTDEHADDDFMALASRSSPKKQQPKKQENAPIDPLDLLFGTPEPQPQQAKKADNNQPSEDALDDFFDQLASR